MSRCQHLVAIKDGAEGEQDLQNEFSSPANCGNTVNQLLWLIRKLCILD